MLIPSYFQNLVAVGCYELESVHSSVGPSVRLFIRPFVTVFFLGTESLVFLDVLHEVREPQGSILKESIFGGICTFPEVAKMGPKWAKNKIFDSFWKILSLLFD